MSPSTWWPVPYGPLQPFREYILSHSVPITWQNLPYAALLPIIPIGLQAYLLQSGGTRVWRIALAVLGLSFLWNAVTGYRFVREYDMVCLQSTPYQEQAAIGTVRLHGALSLSMTTYTKGPGYTLAPLEHLALYDHKFSILHKS